MSRSYRHTPVYGHCSHTEKEDKRIYNRCLRTGVRRRLRTWTDFDARVLPIVREFSNQWNMNKDGKTYDSELASYLRSLRKEVRVRDGRCRYVLVLTDRTQEIADKDRARLAIRFHYGDDETLLDSLSSRFGVTYHVDILRK